MPQENEFVKIKTICITKKTERIRNFRRLIRSLFAYKIGYAKKFCTLISNEDNNRKPALLCFFVSSSDDLLDRVKK